MLLSLDVLSTRRFFKSFSGHQTLKYDRRKNGGMSKQPSLMFPHGWGLADILADKCMTYVCPTDHQSKNLGDST